MTAGSQRQTDAVNDPEEWLAVDREERKQASRKEWMDKFSHVWTKYDKDQVTVRKAEWDRLSGNDRYVMCLTVVQVAHDTPYNASVHQYTLKVQDEDGNHLGTWTQEKSFAVTTPEREPVETVPEKAAPPAQPRNPPANELPTRTITPGKDPVAVALAPPDLAKYKQANAVGKNAAIEKMVKDGVIQLITEPTKVRFETTIDGLAYVRLTDGPLKDKLAVVDAGFVK